MTNIFWEIFNRPKSAFLCNIFSFIHPTFNSKSIQIFTKSFSMYLHTNWYFRWTYRWNWMFIQIFRKKLSSFNILPWLSNLVPPGIWPVQETHSGDGAAKGDLSKKPPWNSGGGLNLTTTVSYFWLFIGKYHFQKIEFFQR